MAHSTDIDYKRIVKIKNRLSFWGGFLIGLAIFCFIGLAVVSFISDLAVIGNELTTAVANGKLNTGPIEDPLINNKTKNYILSFIVFAAVSLIVGFCLKVTSVIITNKFNLIDW